MLADIGRYASAVPEIRVRDAAELLGVSDDTVRRWIDDGALTAHLDASGRKVIDGAALAAFARANASGAPKARWVSAVRRAIDSPDW